MNRLAYIALWIFIFSIPADPVLSSGRGLIVSKIMGVLALGLALVPVVVTGRLRRLHLLHMAALSFVLWIACSLVFFYNTWIQLPNKFWTFVQLLLVLWMIWELAVTRSRVIGLLAAYVLGAFVSAFDTILIYRHQASVLRRFSAGGIDGNDLAMTLGLAIPIAWYLAMTFRQPIRRWISTAYLPFGLFAIGLTGSRGGMISTMVALLIVPLTLARLSPGKRAIGIMFLCISGAVAVTYVPETLIERLASTTTEVEGGRLGGRMKIWQAGLKAFSIKPLVGYGPASFKRAIDPWLIARVQVAHNSFLSVLVEEGLVGLLLYLTMFFAVGRAVLKLPFLERRFALVVLAALMTSMLPLTSEDSKRVWFILAILLAFSQSYVATGGATWRQGGGQTALRAGPRRGMRGREPLTAPLRNIGNTTE